MATTQKRKSPGSSKTFPIVVTVVVLAMVAVIVLTITSNKEANKSNSKIEVSPSATVSASTVNGVEGETQLPAFTDAATDQAQGLIVPSFTTRDFADKTVTIAPEGKPYVLAFLAHWCPNCQKEVPKIVSLYENGDLPADVEFIAVATGTTDTKPNYPPSQWLLEEEWPWKQVADDQGGTIASAFGLPGYPYLVFVKADGTVSSRLSGLQPDDSLIVNAANAISEK